MNTRGPEEEHLIAHATTRNYAQNIVLTMHGSKRVRDWRTKCDIVGVELVDKHV